MIRMILFEQKGYYVEPVGEKPKTIYDIMEFDYDNMLTKRRMLSAIITNPLNEWMKKVNDGKTDTKDTIFTMSFEHVDKR